MIYKAAEVEVDKRNRGAGFSLRVDWCFFGGGDRYYGGDRILLSLE